MHQLQISFPSADGLVAGSDVLEAGSKVGYISDIQPTQRDQALVTVMISDSQWPLHAGLTAGIRPKSLLGEKYVDLHDGAQRAGAYKAGAVLHAGPEAVPVELDQFINSLDPPTRTAVRVLLDDLGAGVAGRGQDLNAAIAAGKADLANLAVTGQTLNHRDADLDRILVGLDGVLSKITTSDQLTQMSQLISNGQNVLNDIESVRTQFSRQFTDSSAALADLNIAIGGAVPSLRASIDVAPALLANLQNEAQQLAVLGATVTTPANMDAAVCSPAVARTYIDTHIPKGITPCSPLWTLIAGLVPGPTTSGGALETHGSTQNPIFRICLALPSSPSGSCQNSSASQTTSYGGAPSGGEAAFFSDFLGS
jgi:phospholipid/cholesterol/gamma-HCH transport system substrate-binding protein